MWRCTKHTDRSVYFTLNPEVLDESRRLGGSASFEQRYSGKGQNIPDKMTQMKEWDDYIAQAYPGKNIWAFSHHLSILSYRLVKEGFTGNEGNAVAERFLFLDHNETFPPGYVTTYERQCIDDPTIGRRGRLMLQRANEVLK